MYYPGSTLIGQGGKDAENGPVFYSRASAGGTAGTNATIEDVFAFYDRELTTRGWRLSTADTAVGTSDLRAYAWRKGSVIFRLAFLRKGDPRNPSTGDSFTTPFDFALIADDPRDPSWTKKP